jgi:hypothetical protein
MQEVGVMPLLKKECEESEWPPEIRKVKEWILPQNPQKEYKPANTFDISPVRSIFRLLNSTIIKSVVLGWQSGSSGRAPV